MAFKGKHLVRSKIEIDRIMLEKVKQFNYLGCELSLDCETEFDKKNKIFQIYAVLSENISRKPVQTPKLNFKKP
jgi:hypothetical protein